MAALLQPLQDAVRGAACALRAALRRGAVIAAALLIASLGAAFVVFACYIGLRVLIGPGFAALALGAVLLAIAAGILLLAQSAKPPLRPVAPAAPTAPPAAMPSRPADALTTAVFTVAFLLGRQLADHLAQRRGRSGTS